MSSAFQNFLAIIGLTTLIIVGVLGIGMGNMGVNKNGEMNGCLFTGKVMFCKMSIIQHISLWQSMFTAVPTKNIISILLFFLAVFVVGFIILRKDFLNSLLSKLFPLKQQRQSQPNNIFFNPIRYALANGIIHSKIYEPTYF